MGSGIFFPLCAVPFSLLVIILFYVKGHINSKETQIFSVLIISNFVGLLIELLCTYASFIYFDHPLISVIIYKIYLFYIILWISTFAYYIYSIINNDLEIKKNRYVIFIIYYIIVGIILSILPINIIIENDFKIRYTTGASVYFTYLISALAIIVILFMLVTNINKLKNKKYIPVFIFLIIGGIAISIQISNPQLLIMTYIETLICVIMYFTIENPDVKMLQQMTLAKDLAEKANRAKSDFLSSMSHEIRTPLNAIVGLSEDIVSYKDQVPNEVALDATDIQNASQTLLEIVGNILDINKIESEKMEIINTPYNLKKEIVSLCKVTTSRIKEKPIEFKLDIAEDLPEELIGDRIHIKQVINNLLSNAIKYTEKGMITLGIKCINEKDICKLIISVKDTGKGIKAENINKLFTKFERLDVEMNSTTEGTGLGLAITKSLVEMMGGKINVQSQYGKGSIFVVYLPQKISNQKRENIDININELSNENKKDLSGKKILIVDDNKLNIKVAIKALQDFKFEIEECYDGIECIEKVKEKEYDLILMDIMMPNMSGERALAKLKENKEFKTPVIALTADAVSGAREKYIKEGFVDYISKPFNKEQVKEKIENIFIQKEEVNTPQKVTYVYDSRTKEEYIIKDGQRNDLDNQL